jgi:hypothetical protein
MTIAASIGLFWLVIQSGILPSPGFDDDWTRVDIEDVGAGDVSIGQATPGQRFRALDVSVRGKLSHTANISLASKSLWFEPGFVNECSGTLRCWRRRYTQVRQLA